MAKPEPAPLFLEITPGLRIWAPELPPELHSAVMDKLGHFAAAAQQEPPNIDIYLSPLEEVPKVTAEGEQMDALYGFWLTRLHGRLAVVFFKRAEPALVVLIGEKLRILYNPAVNSAGKLRTVLAFCVRLQLGRKGMDLCHGAALEKEGATIVLAGQRGIRKTQLSMHLMRRGWHYLADDKFILYGGTAYRFQAGIFLRSYIFEALPWLKDSVPEYEEMFISPATRNNLRHFARSYIPKKLLPNEDRFLNPGITVTAEKLFGRDNVLDSAVPSTFILLHPGTSFSTLNLSREDFLVEMDLLQQLAYTEFNPLSLMLALHDRSTRLPHQHLLHRNMPSFSNMQEKKFTKIAFPEDFDLENLAEEIETCSLHP